jgi:lipoprotein-anchoring transpeptidase ErfK/SrfK
MFVRIFIVVFTGFFLAPVLHADPSNMSFNQVEAERLAHLKNAKTFEQAMDYMTPDEIAADLGLPSQKELDANPPAYIQQARDVLVLIEVSIRHQRLQITSPEGVWQTRVSTARRGYFTKTGCFMVQSMERMHYSRKYDNAPMPFALFYYGGFAVHGTYEEYALGRPASHGCVRVARSEAAEIYEIVARYGLRNTQICVR